MKKWLINAVCVLVVVAMMATFLVGCNKDKNTDGEDAGAAEPTYIEVASRPVAYSEAGTYTTTVEADFNGFTKNDFEVVYETFDNEGYQRALSTASNARDVHAVEFFSVKKAVIDDFKLNNNNTATISFSDSDAARNKTEFYELRANGRNIVSGIPVEFSEYNITSDIGEVGIDDKAIKVTLAIENGTFKAGITKEQIALGGAFKGMKIGSISNGEQYLTMQLAGDIAYDDEASYYPDGEISVLSSAVVNGAEDAKVTIPVKFDSVTFDSKNLDFSDNFVMLPIYVSNLADTASMTKNDISFPDGVNVVTVVTDDEKATFVLEVEGATDKNSAANILNGNVVTIKGTKAVIHLDSANFYPVFDYITKDGDAFKITLKLYANAGTFADGIADSFVTLSEEFAGGEVLSLTRESDTICELVVNVPIIEGQSLEQFSMLGGITLAGGAMVNDWSDVAGEVAYVRDFTNKNIGKDLTGNDIANIKSIVGGFGNTTFGTLSSIASGVSTAASAAKTAMEFFGIIESDTEQIKSLITKTTDKLAESMNYQTRMISALGKDLTELSVNAFISNVNKLRLNNSLINQYLRYAREDLANKGIDEPHSYNATDDDWKEYNDQLITHLNNEIRMGTSKYNGFSARYTEMINQYIAVATDLEMGVNKFDKLCSLTYNANSIAYNDRIVFFSNVNNVLADSFKSILLYNCYDNRKAGGADCAVERELYSKCSDILDKKVAECYNPKSMPTFGFGVKKLPTFYLFGNTSDDTTRVTNWATAGGEIGLSDDAIREFTTRMNGRTFAEEMALAGFVFPKIRDYGKGIVLRYARKRKGSLDGFYHWYYHHYHVFDWDATQPTWDKSLNSHRHADVSPWIDEHLYIEFCHA